MWLYSDPLGSSQKGYIIRLKLKLLNVIVWIYRNWKIILPLGNWFSLWPKKHISDRQKTQNGNQRLITLRSPSWFWERNGAKSAVDFLRWPWNLYVLVCLRHIADVWPSMFYRRSVSFIFYCDKLWIPMVFLLIYYLDFSGWVIFFTQYSFKWLCFLTPTSPFWH